MQNLVIVYPIPVEAARVLHAVQQVVPEAIVAGGCLRDAILNRPINDIDIFVPENRVGETIQVIAKDRPNCTKVIPEPYFTFNNDVMEVRYYKDNKAELTPVNIIGVLKCTPILLARFDFGICRVAFDGLRLWKDLSFDRDQRDETFTLMVPQTEKQREYSLGRFARLSEKYRDWKLVDNVVESDNGEFDL